MNERKGTLIRGKFREYFVSSLAMSASLFLAAIVDTIMVGKILGPDALSALNLTSTIVYIKNIVFSIFIYGGNTLAVMLKGRRDNASADKAFTFSVLFGALTSAAVAGTGILLSEPTAQLLSKGGELCGLTKEYLIPNWASAPFIVINSGLAAYVRTDGMKKLATALPIISNAINLFLDYVFMKIFGWGIAGAGWATVVGYAAGSVLLIIYFRSKERTVRFTKVHFRDIPILFNVWKTGLPTALIHLCNCLRSFFINSIILSSVGSGGLRTVAICLSAFNISMIFINGASTTLMPICGALYGERDYKGVKYALKFSLAVTEIISAAIMALFLIFPVQLASLFTDITPDEKAGLASAIRMFSLSVPFYGIVYIFRAFYQSSKQRFAASLFTVIEGFAIIVPLIYLLSKISTDIIWLAFAISEFAALAVTLTVMQINARRKNCTSFLMFEDSRESDCLDMTISNTIDDAVAARDAAEKYCTEHGTDSRTANILAVTVEELAVNSVKYAYDKKNNIDICLRLFEDKVVLRLRDDGKLFDPTAYIDDSGELITGLKLVRGLTSRIEYARVLGFNETIVTVNTSAGL